MLGYDWASDSLKNQAGLRFCFASCGSGECHALASSSKSPLAAQGTGLCTPGVELDFAPPQSSGEKLYVSVCARVGDDDLAEFQLSGFGRAGKLEVHLFCFVGSYLLGKVLFIPFEVIRKQVNFHLRGFAFGHYLYLAMAAVASRLSKKFTPIKKKILHFSIVFLV